MNLDLRLPVFVITGHWNPRIFEIGWIAQNLFQKQGGEMIEIGQVINQSRNDLPVTYIEGIGVASLPDRLEIYAAGDSEDDLKKASAVAQRAIEVLSHTPVFALGINFALRTDGEIVPEVSEKMATGERLDERFQISSVDFRTTMAFRESITLNVQRAYSATATVLTFNFHQAVESSNKLIELLQGNAPLEYLTEVKRLLSDIYDIPELGIEKFNFEDVGGEYVEA